jgi:hypothetical protein
VLVSLLTDAERTRLSGFPKEISYPYLDLSARYGYVNPHRRYGFELVDAPDCGTLTTSGSSFCVSRTNQKSRQPKSRRL